MAVGATRETYPPRHGPAPLDDGLGGISPFVFAAISSSIHTGPIKSEQAVNSRISDNWDTIARGTTASPAGAWGLQRIGQRMADLHTNNCTIPGHCIPRAGAAPRQHTEWSVWLHRHKSAAMAIQPGNEPGLVASNRIVCARAMGVWTGVGFPATDADTRTSGNALYRRVKHHLHDQRFRLLENRSLFNVKGSTVGLDRVAVGQIGQDGQPSKPDPLEFITYADAHLRRSGQGVVQWKKHRHTHRKLPSPGQIAPPLRWSRIQFQYHFGGRCCFSMITSDDFQGCQYTQYPVKTSTGGFESSRCDPR